MPSKQEGKWARPVEELYKPPFFKIGVGIFGKSWLDELFNSLSE
jgi:hypothetical protein